MTFLIHRIHRLPLEGYQMTFLKMLLEEEISRGKLNEDGVLVAKIIIGVIDETGGE